VVISNTGRLSRRIGRRRVVGCHRAMATNQLRTWSSEGVAKHLIKEGTLEAQASVAQGVGGRPPGVDRIVELPHRQGELQAPRSVAPAAGRYPFLGVCRGRRRFRAGR
jgi:hypothetical protein